MRITTKLVDRMRELHGAHSVTEIAGLLGVHHTTVYFHLFPQFAARRRETWKRSNKKTYADPVKAEKKRAASRRYWQKWKREQDLKK